MTQPRPTKSKGGFTLVELLVVIGIIALLISILLPSLNRARQAASKVKCLSNLRGIGQAISIYTASSKGLLPPGLRWGITGAPGSRTSWYGPLDTNWSLILQGMLYNQSANNYSDLFKKQAMLADQSRALFLCPDAPSSPAKPTEDAITNNLSYAVHPLFFGGQLYEDTANVSPCGNIGGYSGRMRQYKINNIKQPSQTVMIADATVIPAGNNVKQDLDNPMLYLVDGALMTKSPWTLKTLFSAKALDAARPLDSSIDMSPWAYLNGSPNPTAQPASNCNTDSDKNTRNVRFRHINNTVANTLMADGHAEGFTLNKTKLPNDPQKTDLLRRYFYYQ